MSERRRALGRGLGALIPSGAGETQNQRPVDVFFRDRQHEQGSGQEASQAATAPKATAAPDPESAGNNAAKPASEAKKANGAAARKGGTTATRGGGATAKNASATSSPATASPDGGSDGGAEGAEGAEAPLSASEALLQELESGPSSEDSPAGTKTGKSRDTQPKAAQQAKRKSPASGGPRTEKTKKTKPAKTSPTKTSPTKSGPADPERTEQNHVDSDSVGSEGLQPVPGATFAEVPIESLSPNASQPRQVFDDDELNELASSIREVGVLQPVVVRPSGTDADGQATYELIMGERRWRAARIAAQTAIPAIIRETAHEDMLRDALLENLHRVQLNPLEEAAAYQQLLEDFGCTHDELAVRIARSRPQISNTLRLMKLPPLVQRRVAAGILSAGHARALLGLSDGAAMERLAQRIVAEGLSVRATEEIIALGDEPMQPEMRRRPHDGGHSVALHELAGRLSDGLDTKVKVKLGQRKGHVSIEFASLGDLNRILGVLVPSDPGVSDGVEQVAVEDAAGVAEAGD